MPIADKDHRGVPVTPAVAFNGRREPVDLVGSQILARPQVAIGDPFRGNCTVYGGWRDQLEVRLRHRFCPPSPTNCSYDDRSSNIFIMEARRRRRVILTHW